ncbi:G-type lectin S-receptor-like serine/threonine-protein kinase B120 [Platanthera guangdongensis]|uniref:Receptor-like serine/threonine-protein kinase n=1 Tax=Platanthera guangdongensis TaxID=2320717 RepID=A0ABR2MT25_9ASPA
MGCFDHLYAFLFSLTAALPLLSLATTSVVPGSPLTDGVTIVSPGGVFELGFFSPGRSTNRYIGIWYHNFSASTVVWVANRDAPVPDTSGSLSISGDGNLVVLDGRSRVLWSSDVFLPAENSTAQLLDTGNLVLRNSGGIGWQSFDCPTDTYLPGMKVGLDLRTNVNHLFTSWKSADDPAPGNFSMGMNPDRSTQIFIWGNGKPLWRSGRWNGQIFMGVEGVLPEYIYGFRLSNFQMEGVMYFYFNSNTTQRYVLTSTGVDRQLLWQNDTNAWKEIWAQPTTQCEVYNRCGANASCTDTENGSAPDCSCLKGFVPSSSGCVRRAALNCGRNRSQAGGEPDRFYQMQGLKLPDFSDWDSASANASQCEGSCLANCSCNAYSFVTGIGCLIWGRELSDIHVFDNGGNDFYLRLAASEFVDKKSTVSVFLILVISIPTLAGLVLIWLLWMIRRKIRALFNQPKRDQEASAKGNEGVETETGFSSILAEDAGNGKGPEWTIFTVEAVLAATKDFSSSNLLGQGGFGPVYKGLLPEGQEIAVKRLSKGSGQGMEEFKNEVILIAKLQHRNLVKLLGFCAQRDDKMLIYEYMPNKSLDVFLFDRSKKRVLDWSTRCSIVEGIARGLLYLHRDSRLRIIHRDLKASNILLDAAMNPKISDFGMARIFGNTDGNETATKRVVGTYGYMSPEYAMQGLFSVKSDVYSFGVLILEIVSGERNSTYQHPLLSLNLIAYAWKLWNEDNVMEFVDPTIRDSCLPSHVSRCVHVGLWCVQDRASERPTTATVIAMLEGGTVDQPNPRQPTFAFERGVRVNDLTDPRYISGNSLAFTILSGR